MSYKPLTKAEAKAHEAKGGDAAVYVGTYRKYNDGSLYGQWVNLDSFDSYDEFMEYLHRLHYDEYDPEFMFQDYEGFPEEFYSESGMDEDTFDLIKEYLQLDDPDAYEAYCSLVGGRPSIEEMQDRLLGGPYDTQEDFVYEMIDSFGGVQELGRDTLENYFDYSGYTRDVFFDYHWVDGYVFDLH